MRGWSICVAAALALASCSTAPQSYSDPREIAAAMADADIGCNGLQTAGGPRMRRQHLSLVAQQGTCRAGRATIVITLFETREDRDDWVALTRLLGPVAVGPNWAVTTDSRALVRDIAGALHGSEPG